MFGRVFGVCSVDDQKFINGELQADAGNTLESFNWK